jgi:predicted deacetylase
MNWGVWRAVEEILVDHQVRPILGVIPDNRDETLHIDPPESAFWERVRVWQSRGWTIAVHGLHHVFETDQAGLFGWNQRSEFAGLSFEEQDRKIKEAVRIFRSHGIRPEAWIAPNHSFDATTLRALRAGGVRIVSDGLGLLPYRDNTGMFWVPMQSWRFERRPYGVWTVCLHPNKWSSAELRDFRKAIAKCASRTTDVETLIERYGYRTRSALDRLFAAQRRTKKHVRRQLERFRRH